MVTTAKSERSYYLDRLGESDGSLESLRRDYLKLATAQDKAVNNYDGDLWKLYHDDMGFTQSTTRDQWAARFEHLGLSGQFEDDLNFVFSNSLLADWPLVEAATFEATEGTYLTANTGHVGFKESYDGLFSGWFRSLNAGTGLSIFFGTVTNIGPAIFTSSGSLFLFYYDDANVICFQASCSNTSITDTSSWHHVLVSWRTSTSECQVYIDDQPQTVGASQAQTTFPDFTKQMQIGATTGSGFLADYDFSEFWLEPRTYLDLSVESNRRKFITADLRPVYLGYDGELPTGTLPLFYHKLNSNNLSEGRGIISSWSVTNPPLSIPDSPSD